MYEFDYVRPGSLDEAVRTLAEHADGGQILAGGQTLLPTLKQRLNQPEILVDLGAIPELRGITQEGGLLRIGAMTNHCEVATDGAVRATIPALATLAAGIGDPQVRALGTIGGSLANNDPAADYPAAVLALEAVVVTDRRRLVAEAYFQGFFATALEPGEIIVAVEFPVPDAATYGRFEQRASRFPLVGVFLARKGSAVRAAVVGAGSDGVFRCVELEQALAESWSAEAARGVVVPHGTLIGDMHGGAEYRAALIAEVAARALSR